MFVAYVLGHSGLDETKQPQAFISPVLRPHFLPSSPHFSRPCSARAATMISNQRTFIVSFNKLRTNVSVTAIVPGPSAAHHVLKFASNFLPINRYALVRRYTVVYLTRSLHSSQTLRHRIAEESNVQAVHLDHIWDVFGPKVYHRFLEIKESYDDKESGFVPLYLICHTCRN